MQINENFLRLPGNYLFADIAEKVKNYKESNPDARLIRLGIGDVTRPLPKASIEAMHRAVDELADASTFRGYGPEQGYAFLREAIIREDYASRGICLHANEVFVSDGAKSDCGNIVDILGANVIGMTDPIYPVYVDSNAMAGRAGVVDSQGLWSDITYFPCNADNGFVPEIPRKHVDVIYLCFPNNPTGTTLTHYQLKKWVDYALANDALILFDAAYEAFITEDDVPHSIYEIKGAKHCAIEFRSFSKTAGFTGVRCGYTVIPDLLTVKTSTGKTVQLNQLWNRRQCTKFNGTSYVTQRGAEAIYTPEGKSQVRETIAYYLNNAKTMRKGLTKAGLTVYGGVNSPYLWVRTPNGMTSWEFFDHLLRNVNIVSTPGSGFGPSGEGYLRLTAFGTHEDCTEAMERISKSL